MNVPSGTEARVCADIAKRQARGINKYGTTVADNPLKLRDWLQHAYEETLDKAVYLKRAIEEIDATNDTGQMQTASDGRCPRCLSTAYDMIPDVWRGAECSQCGTRYIRLTGAEAMRHRAEMENGGGE